VSEIRTAQLRLIYSLLKPAVAMAARFHVPMRTFAELLRLAYFEVLRREGLSQAAVGDRLGQTARHMRTLARKLKGDFFAAEVEVGLVREVESEIARSTPTSRRLHESLPGWSHAEVDGAVEALLVEGRIVRDKSRFSIARRYVVLGSDKFHHRVDALNHFMGGVSQAVAQRLIFEERDTALVKTISLLARPQQFQEFLRSLEANLRRDIASLEEDAAFEGEGERFVLGLFAATDRPEPVEAAARAAADP
jgi:hypothetical protein